MRNGCSRQMDNTDRTFFFWKPGLKYMAYTGHRSYTVQDSQLTTNATDVVFCMLTAFRSIDLA